MLSFSWMLELETGVWAEGTTIVVSSSNDPGNMRRSALILRFCLEEFRANQTPPCIQVSAEATAGIVLSFTMQEAWFWLGLQGRRCCHVGVGGGVGQHDPGGGWPVPCTAGCLSCGGGWGVGHLGGTPILLALKRERPLWGVSPSAMKYASEIMEKLKAPVLLCSFAFHF